jgi:glycosyltransferase involved in cell wall biosynthesis
MSRTRVLWMSDSPDAPTGYGNVTRAVCEGLAQRGCEVFVLGFQNPDQVARWRGMRLLPMGKGRFGEDLLPRYLEKIRPHLLVTLTDLWWVAFATAEPFRQALARAGSRWAVYFPVEGHGTAGSLPPLYRELLQLADAPIAMSRYGQRVALANGVSADYIPHGVDSSAFQPPPDRAAAKQRLGYQGRFVILSDARNQQRKMLHRLLTIFARFARRKRDVLLHLHCDPDDTTTRDPRYSYSVADDVRALGLGGKVRMTAGFSLDTSLRLDELVTVYQAADVHLLTSTGEGFGLPTLQAAACGVVPVAVDYSANSELIAGHGLTVRPAGFLSDDLGLARAVIDVSDAVDKLEQLYHDGAGTELLSRRARGFALEYDWSRVLASWTALIERERQLGPTADGSPRTVPPEVHPSLQLGEVALDEPGSPSLHIPIARTERSGPARVPRRQGALYIPVRSRASARVAARLRQVFPRVLDVNRVGRLADPFSLRPKTLERCVLAIDLEGSEADLPVRAAVAGVPLVGPRGSAWQERLFPLAAVGSEHEAFLRAREILCDHLLAVHLTETAREALEASAVGATPQEPADAADTARMAQG